MGKHQAKFNNAYSTWLDTLKRKIVAWYEREGDKNLPWRTTNNKWVILCTALMLQKTTVAQVALVYEPFFSKFPSPEKVLNAGAQSVEAFFSTLGMKNRASRIYRIAEQLCSKYGCAVPCSKDELLSLHGVGKYIASEILLLGCGIPAPLLDTNSIRVLIRFFGIRPKASRAREDKALWVFAEEITPKDPEEAKKFWLGLIDLGRKVCRNIPQCGECPLSDFCYFHLFEAR